MPSAVLEYVVKELAGKKIEEAAKIESPAEKVTYEAEVGGVDYLFDEAGNFLSKKIKISFFSPKTLPPSYTVHCRLPPVL